MASGDGRLTFGVEDPPKILLSDKELDEEEALEQDVPWSEDRLPVQLVKMSPSGLELCEEGVRFLASIKAPMGVISFAGPYRSGKSFALNMMLEAGASGFSVGNTVKACTQGLWLWSSQRKQNGTTYILLDSEGSGNTSSSQDQDGKLFALVILISSLFVFNTMGVIDEHAINQLSLAAYMYEQLTVEDEDQEDQSQVKAKLVQFSPKFIWLLRDFHLALVDRSNQPLTPRDYMDNVLTSENYKGRNIENFQKVRDLLLNLFLDRDCFVLPRPADSESDLNRLNDLPRDNLRPKFLDAFEKFKTAVFETCPVKMFNGKAISGKELLSMAERIITAINKGVLPNLESSWNGILEAEYEVLLKNMKVKYLKLRNVSLENMPYEEAELVLKLHVISYPDR